jgi:hypothetical protein
LRILFSVRNAAYVRYYDSVLRTLAARGHDVQLVMQSGKRSWPPSVLALAQECPGIRLSTMPEVAFNPWWELASRLRHARFYLRFLKPEYRNTPELLARARARAPRAAVRLGKWVGRGHAGRRLLVRLIDLLEQSTRSTAAFHHYLRERRPDVVVSTPLVVLKTTQLDLARAAMELGIRNVFAVASWDHLSSKSQLNFKPQQVFVWNEIQKREAVALHHLEAEHVVVTGSQVFDEWFQRQPSTTREEFCARVGLRPDRPILLYVCSSLLEGSPPEPAFVVQWARYLRESGHPVLRDCGILVRPHFRRRREWRGVDVASLPNAVCWPPEGDAPVDARSKTDYFDSLYHATATVGLNTSAMIEAAILGRSVHTVLLPEFHHSQEGTVHFHYLLGDADGLLRAARSLDEHARDLAATLDGRDPDPDRSARFVRSFLRPRGLDVPATTRFVDALETLAAGPAPPPLAVPVWTRLIRPMLRPFAHAAAARARRSKEDSRRQKQRNLLEHRRRKAAGRAARAQHPS